MRWHIHFLYQEVSERLADDSTDGSTELTEVLAEVFKFEQAETLEDIKPLIPLHSWVV